MRIIPTQRRRHLMRLWLATEAGPPLADPYYEFMDKTDLGRPNGYLMPVKLTAPLVVEDGGPGASEQRGERLKQLFLRKYADEAKVT